MSKITKIRENGFAKTKTEQGDRFAFPDNSVGTKQLKDGGVTVKKLALTDIIVGSPAQVAAGNAHHSSLQSAHDAAISGKIILLPGTITESVTWSKSDLTLEGKGRGSVLSGTFTVSGSGNIFQCLKFNGNVNLNGDGNFFSNSYIAATFSLADAGAGNQTFYIQET